MSENEKQTIIKSILTLRCREGATIADLKGNLEQSKKMCVYVFFCFMGFLYFVGQISWQFLALHCI